ncbi:MAG TPA: DUF6510 family protein [Candidatus Acidoferrum sp.]|nr:DUF6510 family protein [Candidatus Acidoferrum sp.]
MSQNGDDMNKAMMLDGNAAGGMLYDIFSAEMTASPTICASCGRHEQLGELRAFTHAPGMILRCPACDNMVLRIVHTDEFTYVDARGAVYLRIAK